MTEPAVDPEVRHELFARRVQYETAGLDVADVVADPIEQWQRWYEDASSAGVREPNAMVLATATPDGEPDARYVLIRGIDAAGFVFHTNHDSAKGRQLAANPRGAGVFTWIDLHRQVRVRGPMSRATDAESDAYFSSRPRDSQIGAWASPQSEVLDRPRRPRRPHRRGRRHVRGPRRAAPGVLGRLAPRRRRDGVLAGPAEPPPRPRPLPPRSGGRLVDRAPRALIAPQQPRVRRMRATRPSSAYVSTATSAAVIVPSADVPGLQPRRAPAATAGGGSAHAAARPLGSSVSTSTSGASTNVRVCTRTLLNGLVRHHATIGSARSPPASTVRPVGAGVGQPVELDRRVGAERRDRHRSSRRRSRRRPSPRSARSPPSVRRRRRGCRAGSRQRQPARCRRRRRRRPVAGTVVAGRRATVPPAIGSGCSVSSSPPLAHAPSASDGGDEQEAAGRQDDAVHDRATPARAATSAAAGGTNPSPVPVRPPRAEAADARRQLELHARRPGAR